MDTETTVKCCSYHEGSTVSTLLLWPQNEGHHITHNPKLAVTQDMWHAFWFSSGCDSFSWYAVIESQAPFLNRQYDVSNLRMIGVYKIQAVVCGSETDKGNKEHDVLQWSIQNAGVWGGVVVKALRY